MRKLAKIELDFAVFCFVWNDGILKQVMTSQKPATWLCESWHRGRLWDYYGACMELIWSIYGVSME